MKKEFPATGWPRVIAGGALWALVYNLVWGVAWSAFVREEWRSAMTAIGRPMPWTAEVWITWGLLTWPLGIVIVKYTADPARSAWKSSLRASAATWVVLALGLAISFVQAKVPTRLVVLDLVVNLIAMLAASAAGAWSLPKERERRL